MHRWITLILLILITAGGVLLFRDRTTLSPLRSEYDRLSSSFGQFSVQDPTTFAIAQIDTGDPHHFLWRVYWPANVNVLHMDGAGGGRSWGSTSRASPSEQLCRVRFRFFDDNLRIFTAGLSGGLMPIGDERIARFFEDHWEELEFESVVEKGEVRQVPLDQPVPVLIVRIPEKLLEELGAKAGQQWKDGILYYIVFGTDVGMKKVGELGLEPVN